ncbi:alpha-mannosidase [Paenibacillus methanolicus]|uniref:Alpha-mannosidase n=1 Tax=Paenibacillus methanolicus TaxID=582686 RepID=A0A5S5C1D9_9BACL|nr:glycoside hydrolase family 38 C-terminal domain-containing protein [Paenibacillus methanolicus]TYP73245.1 alpha-mannosidase [Paenibacillus methanolicus]
MSTNAHFERTMHSFLNKLKQRSFETVIPIPDWHIRSAEYVSPGDIRYTSEWRTIEVGEAWLETTAYFRAEAVVPPSLAGKPLELWFDNQGESLLFVNGEPRQGFDPNRSLCRISDSAVAGETYAFVIESCIRWQNFAHMKQNGLEYDRHLFRHAAWVNVNSEIEDLLYDLAVLAESVRVRSDHWAERLLIAAQRMIKPEAPLESLLAGVRETKLFLRQEWFDGAADKQGTTIIATGHSHLDLAYLWPAKESVRKTGRTFSNMLRLLERYPDFHFAQSQPAQYEYAKKHYPDLYDQIKRYVGEGRWQLVGGMYVEPDCNLTSGESLVRQIQYGQRFYMDEFGKHADICWLPDTFGYSAALPQLLAKSGYRYFYTCKLNYNSVNELPFHSFRWEGLDGSTIIGTLDAFGSYNGQMNLTELTGGIDRFKRKGHDGALLHVFGHGDGGGGVDAGMIERAKRYDKLPGMPAVKLGKAEDFFNQIESANPSFPHWCGELYFEWHQGTFTSQARVKKDNRRSEERLRDAELLGVLAGRIDRERFELLDEAWRLVLFNQFHDILPGTSQAETFLEAERDYGRVREIVDRLDAEAALSLVRRHSRREPSSDADKQDGRGSFIVLNTLSFPRTGWAFLPSVPEDPFLIVDASTGEEAMYDMGADGSVMIEAKDIPSVGFKRYEIRQGERNIPSDDVLVRVEDGCLVLENEYLRVRIRRQDGTIERIYDKSMDRDVLRVGGMAGNTLELFDELYDFYDAWNIAGESLKHGIPLLELDAIDILEQSSAAQAVRIVRSFRSSRIQQTIRLRRGSRELEFETEVDWQEERAMLKAGFELDIHADKATYDAAFGNVERSTRTNTSWERAQYEVPAHQWADVSEANYGAALLNDCKYGYDCKHGKLRITLLKSAKYPDDTADLGKHAFRYALFCHEGDWRTAKVDEAGQCFNVPLRIIPVQGRDGMVSDEKSFLQLSATGIFLSALKFVQTQAGEPASIIIRLYENQGARRAADIRWAGNPIREVHECDLLEQDKTPTASGPQSFQTAFLPYEVKTFRLVLEP